MITVVPVVDVFLLFIVWQNLSLHFWWGKPVDYKSKLTSSGVEFASFSLLMSLILSQTTSSYCLKKKKKDFLGRKVSEANNGKVTIPECCLIGYLPPPASVTFSIHHRPPGLGFLGNTHGLYRIQCPLLLLNILAQELALCKWSERPLLPRDWKRGRKKPFPQRERHTVPCEVPCITELPLCYWHGQNWTELLMRAIKRWWGYGFLITQQVKNPSAMQETQEMPVRCLGREDPLEEEMAPHSSICAWKIPWTEDPAGL